MPLSGSFFPGAAAPENSRIEVFVEMLPAKLFLF